MSDAVTHHFTSSHHDRRKHLYCDAGRIPRSLASLVLSVMSATLDAPAANTDLSKNLNNAA